MDKGMSEKIEVAVRRCSTVQVFLKISQNSQENSCTVESLL